MSFAIASMSQNFPPYALLIQMFFKRSRITHQLPGELCGNMFSLVLNEWNRSYS